MSGSNSIVIGGGISGLSASIYLAKQGRKVKLIEQHSRLGGRANLLTIDGFKFDTGPSWYWMPDVFARVFADWGYKIDDLLNLERLDPSYQIIASRDYIEKFGIRSIFADAGETAAFKVPAGLDAFMTIANRLDPHNELEVFFKEAENRYHLGMHDFCLRPSVSVREFCSLTDIRKFFSLSLFTGYRDYVAKFTSNPLLQRILEFGVLFLGDLPSRMPAMYSMMAYADVALGTWYPQGGMYKIIEALEYVARDVGVEILLDTAVTGVSVQGSKVVEIMTESGSKLPADEVVSSVDYAFFESLLPKKYRNYSSRYWQKRTTSPSALIFYLGIKGKLSKLLHHNLFFDTDVDKHLQDVYNNCLVEDPAFYVSMTSKTDSSVAPAGCENLFVLIPLSGSASYDEDALYKNVLDRIENFCGVPLEVCVKEVFRPQDFELNFHSLNNNAYGLSNALLQTALFKPKLVNRRLNNLYYAGQITVPGGGVPPCLLSGKVVAAYIDKASGAMSNASPPLSGDLS